MQPLGSIEQVRIVCPLAADETDERIDYLLRRAASLVLAIPTVATRLEADEPGLIDLADGVVTDMVARVLRNPDGARSRSSTVGPFSESVTFADGASDLVLLDTERAQLLPGTAATVGRRRIGSIRVRPC